MLFVYHIAGDARAKYNNNLLKRGWTGNTTCVLCMTKEKTVDHLFTRCVFFKFQMATALENIQLSDLGT